MSPLQNVYNFYNVLNMFLQLVGKANYIIGVNRTRFSIENGINHIQFALKFGGGILSPDWNVFYFI